MRKLLTIALLIALSMSALIPAPVSAAIWQGDMAGVYGSDDGSVAVNIYPNGESTIFWTTPYGVRQANYITTGRATSGGLLAVRVANGLPSLDNAPYVVYKPGSPGMLELGTFADVNTLLWVYTLRKLR